MTTYTIDNRPKLLAPGDEVEFVVKGETVPYGVPGHGRWLRSRVWDLPNNHIFNLLSLDAASFASEAYGYAAKTEGWPEASSHGDFPALTRLVNAIYDHLSSLEPERTCKDCPLKEEPKPARLPVGTWVRSLGGANHNGQIGQIVLDDGSAVAPYQVKFSDGKIPWQHIKNVEPVENWERFKVGDCVKGKGVNSGNPYEGKITSVGYTGWPNSHISVDRSALEDTSVEFVERPKAKEDHSFQPGDPVRVTKGTYLPSGTTGTVLGEAEDDGYLVRWNEPDGPHRRWCHRNQIEHYQA